MPNQLVIGYPEVFGFPWTSALAQRITGDRASQSSFISSVSGPRSNNLPGYAGGMLLICPAITPRKPKRADQSAASNKSLPGSDLL